MNPEKPRNPTPAATASGESALSRHGVALCGLGMLAFAAAIAFYATVRLGWWQTVQRGDPDAGPGKTVGPTDPYASDASPLRRALGPLADDLQRTQPPEFFISLGERCRDAKELRLAARFFDVARRMYGTGDEDVKRRVAVMRDLAGALWDSDRRSEALGAMQEELQSLGTDARAHPLWMDFARMSLALGQVESATAAFHETIRRAPGERERNAARRQLWLVWGSMDRLPQVVQLYENMLGADPYHEDALRMALAYYMYVRPDPKRGDELLERLVSKKPDEIELKEMKLQSLAALKRTDEMVRLVGELCRAEPERAVHFREQAVNHLALVGRMDEARSWARDFLEKDTGFEGPAAAAKFYRFVVKDPAAAAMQYAVARSRSKSPTVAAKMLLDEADSRIDARQYDEAERLLIPLLESTKGSTADRNRAGVLMEKIKHARAG
jgi:tetratricopeptide (TPR) repeat protein